MVVHVCVHTYMHVCSCFTRELEVACMWAEVLHGSVSHGIVCIWMPVPVGVWTESVLQGLRARQVWMLPSGHLRSYQWQGLVWEILTGHVSPGFSGEKRAKVSSLLGDRAEQDLETKNPFWAQASCHLPPL